jgi:hypothetical protein
VLRGSWVAIRTVCPLAFGLAVVTQLALPSAAGQASRAQFAKGPVPGAASEARQARAAHARLPLAFVRNAGQSDARVRFQAQAGRTTFFFTRPEAVLSFGKGGRGYALALRFLGANRHVAIVGRRRGPGRINYLVGGDPAKWRTGLPTYGEVVYSQLWPGVDLAFRGSEGELKYEFRLRPGADPARIRLAYIGSDRLSLTPSGALSISTPLGTLTDSPPRSYQPIGGKQRTVSSVLLLRGVRSFGFRIGAYDRRYPLVIDPGLAYSTFLGGASPDIGEGIAVDRAGNAYVTGGTESDDFPTTAGAFDRGLSGRTDGFLTKLNVDGSGLVYSTFLGGSADDRGHAIAVDRAGRAYVTGITLSADFPTTEGAFDRKYNGEDDVFVVKLSSSGSKLAYSTYVGGVDSERGDAIAIDRAGSAFLSGAAGPGFPTTPGAFDRICNADAFVTKLNKVGSKLIYSTCLGGSPGGELGNGLALDKDGHAYLTGDTTSADFPTTPGAFDRSLGGSGDAYVSKLNGDGSALVYSTFLGGIGSDGAEGIAVDRAGGAYVTGDTSSTDFPTTPGAFDTSYGGGFIDAFVTRLNPAGSALAYSTFLGGRQGDQGRAITVDRAGSASLTGQTASVDFPTTPDAFDRMLNGTDAFVTRLDPAGGALPYSTFLGGSAIAPDIADAIAIDGSGDAYVSGGTSSPDFPTTPDAFDRTCGGCPNVGDVFVTKLPT